MELIEGELPDVVLLHPDFEDLTLVYPYVYNLSPSGPLPTNSAEDWKSSELDSELTQNDC